MHTLLHSFIHYLIAVCPNPCNFFDYIPRGWTQSSVYSYTVLRQTQSSLLVHLLSGHMFQYKFWLMIDVLRLNGPSELQRQWSEVYRWNTLQICPCWDLNSVLVICGPTHYLQHMENRENDLKFFPAWKTRGIWLFEKIQGKHQILCLCSKCIALGVDGGWVTKKSSFSMQFWHTIHRENSGKIQGKYRKSDFFNPGVEMYSYRKAYYCCTGIKYCQRLERILYRIETMAVLLLC